MIKVRTTVSNVEKHLIITGHSVNMLGELLKETHVKDEGKTQESSRTQNDQDHKDGCYNANNKQNN